MSRVLNRSYAPWRRGPTACELAMSVQQIWITAAVAPT